MTLIPTADRRAMRVILLAFEHSVPVTNIPFIIVGLDPQRDVRHELLERKNLDFYANSMTLQKENGLSALVSWLLLFLAICLSSRQPFPAKTL